MTSSHVNHSTSVVLLDIEGTTTPIDFVYEVLFPYARSHAAEFLARNLESAEVLGSLAALCEENAADVARGLDPPLIQTGKPRLNLDQVAQYFHWLMDRDRKSTPLKSLQGKIWEAGYRSGELRGQVFADVPPAFERWRRQEKRICIYSSGSILAQKLLFSRTEAGDLTAFIDSYFDTTAGPKREPESYRRIADALGAQPAQIAFISDVTAELEAAAIAGLDTLLSVRPGNQAQTNASAYRTIESFDEVEFLS